MTAGDVANLVATTSGIEVSNLFTTVPATLRYTFGQIAQWFRQIGFATAFAVASLPAVTWSMGTGSGVDNAAGNFTLTAPLSTGAATPASLIFQTGIVGASGAALQTATTVLTLTSSGAVPVANFAGVVGIGTAGVASRGLLVGGTLTSVGGAGLNGILSSATLVASASSTNLTSIATAPSFTPGAFTGLVARGLVLTGYSVATFTSPADPTNLDVGAVTGTGATNAYGIRIAPPTGAGANYLISHTTAATFNVLASGAITTASTITSGLINGQTISSAANFTGTLAITGVQTNSAAINVSVGAVTAVMSVVGSVATWGTSTNHPLNFYVNNGASQLTVNAAGVAVPGTLAVTGAFGANAAAPQTAFASGGALNAYGAGINGFDTAGNVSALYAMVVALRAALVANGIMS